MSDPIPHLLNRRFPGSFTPPKSIEYISWGLGVLSIILFGTLLHFSLTILNPDWLSYRLIYEAEGAWLSEQGRDPAFLMLTAFLENLFGPQGYEAYRIFFALYFLVFIGFLSSGYIFKFKRKNYGHLFLMIAIVYFGFTRFTIQIREGIALTLVVLSLALVAKRSHDQARSFLRRNGKPSSQGLLLMGVTLPLFVVAALVHLATLSVLLIYLAGLWVTRREIVVNGRPLPSSAESWRLSLVWILAFLFAGMSVMQLYLGGSLGRIVAETVGDRLADAKGLSAPQLVFWGLYGGACWLINRETRAILKQKQVVGTFASFLQILSGPAITATYMSILLALILAVTPLFIVSYVRLLHMLMAIALLCLAVTGQRRWQMSAVGIFLIADQMRSILESISISAEGFL